MIKPTIYGCVFPYRGPKNRLDISNFLTSAKYDINLCMDFTNSIKENNEDIMLFYTNGKTDSSIQSLLIYSDKDYPQPNLNSITKEIDNYSNQIKSLLF